MSAEDLSYRVVADEGVFMVFSPSDTMVMECRDQASADHYADLMTKAWKLGFKAGYRHARSL